MEQIFQILTDLNIPYELQEHKAIFSEEDSKDVEITLEGIDVLHRGLLKAWNLEEFRAFLLFLALYRSMRQRWCKIKSEGW